MVLVQNKYKNTLVGVPRTQITFVTHSSPSCYVALSTQVIRLNSCNLGPQKTDSVFLLLYCRLELQNSHGHSFCSLIIILSVRLSVGISPRGVATGHHLRGLFRLAHLSSSQLDHLPVLQVSILLLRIINM